MRGADEQSGSMFSYLSPEERLPQDHPLRAVRRMTDRALARLSARFGTLYVKFGRPSVPPEKLLRALLLQALYSIRSERQLMEQLDFNILFRWFVGLGLDDRVWSATTFTKNRDRLLDGDIAAFFEAVLIQAEARQLLSNDHFTVDGTDRLVAEGAPSRGAAGRMDLHLHGRRLHLDSDALPRRRGDRVNAGPAMSTVDTAPERGVPLVNRQ